MYYIGVDLAWGQRNPTGVAVLDAGGVLVDLGVAGHDDDVLARVGPYCRDDCVVAIDAPLVVRNASGNRPCEAQLNRDFRRYQAGAHPANTGLAWFADGGRGARLCAALDLDLDPRSGSSRAALEVYPHAACVALFGLSTTLKYKQKAGREVSDMRSELLRLIGFIEGLDGIEVTAAPAWVELRTCVEAATRKSELRRAEDPVDSVLCAYLARFAHLRPEQMTIYGDPETGCIVTPTHPALR